VTNVPSSAAAQYYVTDVTLTNANFVQLLLMIKVDDGVIVRVNGVEVARANMPFGTPTNTTTAWSPKTGTPGSSWMRVPSSMLVVGTNRISAEVHQASASNDVDGYFDMSLTALVANGDVTPPSIGATTFDSISRTAINVNWPTATDNAEIAYYEVKRNGVVISIRPSWTRSYYDQQLAAATTYAYVVTAVDSNGNRTSAPSANATTLP
jgi:hypothetical protein